MEHDLAILIADLSGYTALTETHGSVAAADVVDEFKNLVEKSLVGQAHLHQSIGDEVMIVSSSTCDLLSTATILLQNCRNQHAFLQVHGGMHFGKILKRGDNYFGSTVNLASRIASHAPAGCLCCSADLINSTDKDHDHKFLPKGKMSFKNVSEEIEVFELVTESGAECNIDPVCRMLISDKANAVIHPDDEQILFCSEHCLNIYTKNSSAS